jgi:hypothetical protein
MSQEEDWRYSPDRMELRGKVLQILLSKYGHQMQGTIPKYSSQKIFECAHDWVSQGNNTTFGITKYFEAYYT